MLQVLEVVGVYLVSMISSYQENRTLVLLCQGLDGLETLFAVVVDARGFIYL